MASRGRTGHVPSMCTSNAPPSRAQLHMNRYPSQAATAEGAWSCARACIIDFAGAAWCARASERARDRRRAHERNSGTASTSAADVPLPPPLRPRGVHPPTMPLKSPRLPRGAWSITHLHQYHPARCEAKMHARSTHNPLQTHAATPHHGPRHTMPATPISKKTDGRSRYDSL